MAMPEARPGLVIRYDYLWTREAAVGRREGKDRPACVVAASDSTVKPRFAVILTVTHSAPTGDTVGVAIPPKVQQAIGLDDAAAWVIVSEHNVDRWPNAGLAEIPGRRGVFHYGFIPPGLFSTIKARFLELAARHRGAGVQR